MPPGRPGPGTNQRLVPGLASSGTLLVATGAGVFLVDAGRGTMTRSTGLEDRLPTCLAAGPPGSGRAWCGTHRSGVFRSDDGGASWQPAGLGGRRIMSLAVSGSGADGVVWAGTEPSEVWRLADGDDAWERTSALERLPSSSGWAFPPRPETHHVRWIAPHPHDGGTLWVAVEAGALVSTRDGGRVWQDRVPDGPFDTHELAVHPSLPDRLRVAAGDGYYESHDGGATWSSPREGLEVGYLRSVAIDPGRPDVVVVSGATGPRSAYVAGLSDGRVYRRADNGRPDEDPDDPRAHDHRARDPAAAGSHGARWERVVDGWPEPPETIAPLLTPGTASGQLWAADERGVHASEDGGSRWRQVAAFPDTPRNLRGLVATEPAAAGRS